MKKPTDILFVTLCLYQSDYLPFVKFKMKTTKQKQLGLGEEMCYEIC